MITLKDIAKIAGVNVSTVSKALRDSSDISEKTKQYIRSIADELNYKYKLEDNNDEKTKSSNSLNMAGIICPEITSSYYSEIVNTIAEEMRKEDYYCIIGFSNFDRNNEVNYLKDLLHSHVNGIIYITEDSNIGDILSAVKNEKKLKPIVVITQNSDTKEFDCIKIDDEYGIKLSVEYLLQQGHTNIGYIGDELSNARMEAFIKVLQENNLNVNKNWIQVSKERFEKCGYSLLKNMLKTGDLPTALVGAYDSIVIGAIKAICEAGLSVPDDISIIGIDNISVSAYFNPGITTIATPIDEMARIAANLLIKKIKSPEYKVVQHIVLTPALVIRNSVKKLK